MVTVFYTQQGVQEQHGKDSLTNLSSADKSQTSRTDHHCRLLVTQLCGAVASAGAAALEGAEHKPLSQWPSMSGLHLVPCPLPPGRLSAAGADSTLPGAAASGPWRAPPGSCSADPSEKLGTARRAEQEGEQRHGRHKTGKRRTTPSSPQPSSSHTCFLRIQFLFSL